MRSGDSLATDANAFHAEIAQTLHDPADLDDETRHLVAALAE